MPGWEYRLMNRRGPRRVVILGSTGSIGVQALEVIAAHPDRFEILALCAGSDAATLEEQARQYSVRTTGLGESTAVEFAALEDADVVLNAIVGAVGLRASIAALETGKVLALANKESLVAGGEVCLAATERGGGRIAPVDSEHAALAQCLEGRDRDSVERLVITASGGPFRSRADLASVTPEEALQHPTWRMGPKITIDSATMMNKALEVIEAHHLFGLDYERIDLVVHPQSIIHGIVEFTDASLVMQAAPTDMKIPIQAALATPLEGPAARLPSPVTRLDLSSLGALVFEPVDRARFPAVDLGHEAGRKGLTYPAVLNAANEVAVHAFLDRRISFTAITTIVEQALAAHDPIPATELEAVLDADSWARDRASSLVRSGGS
jgi:1-deoxy-D-xylulose-5-phosphate reductoisomerase